MQSEKLNNPKLWEETWDDVSGKALRPALVRAARKEEIEYFRSMRMYDEVPIRECVENI